MTCSQIQLRLLCLVAVTFFIAFSVRAGEPIDIGARRELFVDQYLIEQLDGVRLELHRPERREIVFRTDAPWEGNGSAYQSVFQDGDRFRIYYRGGHHPASKAYETDKKVYPGRHYRKRSDSSCIKCDACMSSVFKKCSGREKVFGRWAESTVL